MPIYEFQCNDCERLFETVLSISENNFPKCPYCKSQKILRKISAPKIIFKGSGFYINDKNK